MRPLLDCPAFFNTKINFLIKKSREATFFQSYVKAQFCGLCRLKKGL